MPKPHVIGDTEVYVPVCVPINSIGELIAAPYIDYEGAPWMYVNSEANVFDTEVEEWMRHPAREEAAELVLNTLLIKWGDK